MREATISAGVWLTYLVSGLGELYVVLTWQRPHRAVLAILFAAAIAASAGVSMVPRQTLVRSRFREPFFFSWTMLNFVLILLGTLVDGGTSSPLVVAFFMPVVFSSMSYPLGSVVSVGVVGVLCYLGLALGAGGASTSYEIAFATILTCTGTLSAWQAQNHKAFHDALAVVSRTDPLTGCLNRRGFEERAVVELADMARQGRRGALMVLDIDHFKPVNDRYGHAAGDELLIWVVTRLTGAVRAVDSVGRLGGDEFAVLFPEIEPEDALASVERIRAILSERAPASIGLAASPIDGTELEQLTRTADLRLYESRRARRSPGPAGPESQGSREPAYLAGRGRERRPQRSLHRS
jgi:diguanylate cyclase (GGDEF)-like protein